MRTRLINDTAIHIYKTIKFICMSYCYSFSEIANPSPIDFLIRCNMIVISWFKRTKINRLYFIYINCIHCCFHD